MVMTANTMPKPTRRRGCMIHSDNVMRARSATKRESAQRAMPMSRMIGIDATR